MRSLLLFLVVIGCSLRAQSPEDAVRLYVDTVKAQGMGSVAALMHPDELAKFQGMMAPVIEMALGEQQGRAVFGRFSDPADETKLRPLNPPEFLSAFLQCIEALQPQLTQIMKVSTVDILGHVKEGDVCHVVTRFRTKYQGMEIEKLSVMSTKDHQGTAKMILSGEIKQMAEVLRARR